MTIKIEITGEDAQAVATQLLVMGSLITQKVGPKTQGADGSVNVDKAVEVEAEVVETKKAPKDKPAKAKKAEPETIEHEAEPDPKEPETAPDETKAEEPADEKEMTVDELRLYTMRHYLQTFYEGHVAQKDAFAKLLEHFKLAKFGDIADNEDVTVAQVKAEVDKRIAAAAKAKKS